MIAPVAGLGQLGAAVISKAKTACDVSDHAISDHFVDVNKMVDLGSGNQSEVEDIMLTRQEGWNSIAVYKDGKGKKEVRTKDICRNLLGAGRVNFVASADYSEGSVLERLVKLLLTSVMARIEYQRELFTCNKEHKLIG